MKQVNLILGWLFLALGVIGIPLPLLPTTPLLLLSAFFFSRSSPRLHRWLLSRPRIGKVLRDWEEHRRISRRAKFSATIAIVLLFGILVFSQDFHFALVVLLLLTASGVLIFIWTRAE